MKIVYCLPDTFRPGGIERVVSLKANYLMDVMGYNVTIITTGQGDRLPYYHFSEKIKFVDLGINYDDCLKANILNRIIFRLIKKSNHKHRLNKTLSSLSADIVISTFTHEASFLHKIKDGSKKILEIHFFSNYRQKFIDIFKMSGLQKIYYKIAMTTQDKIATKYDAFVVLSKEDEVIVSKRIHNVLSIPNVLPFYPKNEAKLNNKQVIAVGRLSPEKGYDRLILLWSKIHIEFPDWKLNIFGDGPEKSLLKSLIIKLELENVIFINPPETAIKEQYLKHSILVFTSFCEGFPMVLIEAMACGLPCVSYSCTCGPSDIISNDIDGFVITDGDENTYVEKLGLLMRNEDKRIQMGHLAKKNIIRYSLDVIMVKWDELFKNLINTK